MSQEPLWARSWSNEELLKVCQTLQPTKSKSEHWDQLSRHDLIQRCDYFNLYPELKTNRPVLIEKCKSIDSRPNIDQLSEEELVDCIVHGRYRRLVQQLQLKIYGSDVTYKYQNEQESDLLTHYLSSLHISKAQWIVSWIQLLQDQLKQQIDFRIFNLLREESQLFSNSALAKALSVLEENVDLGQLIVHLPAMVRYISIFIRQTLVFWARDIVSELAHQKAVSNISWPDLLRSYGFQEDGSIQGQGQWLELVWDGLDSILRGRDFERLWGSVNLLTTEVLNFALMGLFSIPVIGSIARSFVNPLLTILSSVVRDTLRQQSLWFLQSILANHTSDLPVLFSLLNIPNQLVKQRFIECKDLVPFCEYH